MLEFVEEVVSTTDPGIDAWGIDLNAANTRDAPEAEVVCI